jgi:MoaA/NifB/PqqE/SkfB family radical SAM enzyme
MAKRSYFFSEKDQNRAYLLKLPHRCNFSCAICGSPDKWDKGYRPVDDVKKEVLKIKEMGYGNIDFGGSEPTLHPQLPEMVKYIIDQGMRPVILTNGSRFCNPDYAKQFIGLNPLGIKVSYHAPEKKLFDELSGHAGSYEKAIQAIKVIQETLEVFPKRRDSFVSASMTVNHYNAPLLLDIVKQVESMGVRILQFSPTLLSADVYKRLDLIITPGDIVEHLRPALKYARSKKMIYYLCNFPPCIMEDQAPFIIPKPSVNAPGWVKFDFCKPCPYNNTCRGVHKGFIMKKYTDELRQIRDKGQDSVFKEVLTTEDWALLDKF